MLRSIRSSRRKGRAIAYEATYAASYGAAGPGETMTDSQSHSHSATCTVVHPDGLEVEVNSGAMTRLAGVSQKLTGSTGIHLAVATVPPGRCSTAHYHTNCESAIYVVSGHGLFLSGDDLEKEDEIGPGDFIYVPPESNHQPVNTSATENLVLIVARNAPVELVVELTGLGRKDCL